MSTDFSTCINSWARWGAEETLDLTGTLQSPSTTSDGQGGITDDWTDAETDVPFNIQYGVKQAFEALIGEAFQGQMRVTIRFPHDQAVSVKQRLYHPDSGRYFHIHGFSDRGEGRILIAAYCTEIQA